MNKRILYMVSDKKLHTLKIHNSNCIVLMDIGWRIFDFDFIPVNTEFIGYKISLIKWSEQTI